MNTKQKASPAAIATLIGATCLAVGFAAWSITRAVKPPAPPPEARATATGQPLPPAPLDLAGPPPADSVQVRRLASSEASLAPYADPFIPLPELPTAVALNRSLPPLAPQSPGGGRPPVLPPLANWPGGPAGLPPAPPLPVLPRVPGAAGSARALTQAAPPPPKPELIGTLMGPQPSAVFRTSEGLKTVPIGGTAAGWRLVAVEHGAVVIRFGSQTSRLPVGGDLPAGGITSSSHPPEPPPAPAGLAPVPRAPDPETIPAPPPAPAPAKPPKGQPVARVASPAPGSVAMVDRVGAAAIALSRSPAALVPPPALLLPLARREKPAASEVAMVEQAPPPVLAPEQAPAALSRPPDGSSTVALSAVALDILPSPYVAAAIAMTRASTIATAPAAPVEAAAAPAQAPVRLAGPPVDLDERAVARSPAEPRPALLLATQPPAGPSVQTPAVAEKPVPVGMNPAGAILAADGTRTPPEQALVRNTDPAALPAQETPRAKTNREKPKPDPELTRL